MKPCYSEAAWGCKYKLLTPQFVETGLISRLTSQLKSAALRKCIAAKFLRQNLSFSRAQRVGTLPYLYHSFNLINIPLLFIAMHVFLVKDKLTSPARMKFNKVTSTAVITPLSTRLEDNNNYDCGNNKGGF